MIASARQKHLFYLEIAKLLEAGFDIRKAAAVLMDTQLPAAQVALLKDLNRGLDTGQTITAAFSSDTKVISALERCIIGAGERGGKLAPAFQHLADYFGMLASAHREVVKSMVYPVIVLHLGIIIAVVPGALMTGEASLAQILGSLVMTLFIVYGVVLIVLLGIRALLNKAPKNPGLDRMINRIPWVGKARRNMAMARFCKVYHSCLLAGISMRETVQLASVAAHSGVIRQAGVQLAAVAESGQALGPQLMKEGAFPKAFARSYSTGEEAGTLDKDLASWSKLFQSDAESSVKTLAAIIPKVLYFFILGFVAWKVVGFYGGYYSSLEQIGE
jgi:type II secretory pathway component PulF